MNNQLSLVTLPRSPYGLKLVAYLNYKQIKVEYKFLEVNDPLVLGTPLQQIPLLLIGDKIIQGSNVILEYLDSISATPLMPRDTLLQAKQRAQLEFANQAVLTTLNLFKSKSLVEVDTNNIQVQWYLSQLESQLQYDFINGDEISLPDFAMFSFLAFARAFPKKVIDLFESHPKVKRYVDKLFELPAFNEAIVKNFEELIMERNRYFGGYISQIS